MILSRKLKNSNVIKQFITNLQKKHYRFNNNISKGFSDALKYQINEAQEILNIDAKAIQISHDINNFKDRKNYGYHDICAVIVAIALYTSEVPGWVIILASILYLTSTNKYFNQLTPGQQEEINTLSNSAHELLNNYDIFYTLDIIDFFSNQDINMSNVDANIFDYLKNYVSMPQVKVQIIEQTSETDLNKLNEEGDNTPSTETIIIKTSATIAPTILKQIQDPMLSDALSPTMSRQGALQQNWNLNMKEYKQVEKSLPYNNAPLDNIHRKEKTKTTGTPQRGFAAALTNAIPVAPQINPKTVIIGAGSITSNCPLRDILYGDLVKVTTNNGSIYHAFWDHGNIYTDRYKVNINKLKKVFDAGKEARNPVGCNGFNRLRVPKYKVGAIQTYEVKDTTIPSRVHGLFHNTAYGLILVFYDYDHSGRETGHK